MAQKHPHIVPTGTNGGDQPSGTGCLGSCLASLASICLSSNSAHPCDTGMSATERPQTATGGPQLVRAALVSGAAETTRGGARVPPKETGPSLSAGGTHMASESGSPSALDLAIGSQEPLLASCDQSIIDTVLSSRAAVIIRRRQMCINPKGVSCGHLAGHARVNNQTVGSRYLVSQFLKGAQRRRPLSVTVVPSWDLTLVLRSVCRPPFEPIGEAELRWLSARLHFCWQSHPQSEWVNSKLVSEPDVYVLVSGWFRGHSPTQSLLPAKEGAFLTCKPGNLVGSIQSTKLVAASNRAVRAALPCSDSQGSQGQPLSKQRPSKRTVNVILHTYRSQGLPAPSNVQCHSTQSGSSLEGGLPAGHLCCNDLGILMYLCVLSSRQCGCPTCSGDSCPVNSLYALMQ